MNHKYNYKDLLTKDILVTLYFLKLEDKTGHYSLKGIVTKLGVGEKTTAGEINEMAKYLEALGYVKAEFTFGDVFITIAPAGIVQIEEVLTADPTLWYTLPKKLAGMSFTLNPKREPPSELELMEILEAVRPSLGLLNELSEESISEAKKPILALLDKMQEQVTKFGNSAQDVINDLSILKMELSKNNPDGEVLAIKLATLERGGMLKSFIPQLRELLNL